MMLHTNVIRKLIANAGADNVPLIISQPGSGVFAAISKLAKDMGTKVFTIECPKLFSDQDLTGIPALASFLSAPTAIKLQPVTMQAAEYAEGHPDETPILVMDGLGMAIPKVVDACANIAMTRSFNCAQLPDNLKIIFTSHGDVKFPTNETVIVNRLNIYRI